MNDDRLTPSWLCDLAMEIMGIPHFSLDPAAHPQSPVQSLLTFYGRSPKDDGFLSDWMVGPTYLRPDWHERPPKGSRTDCFHPLSKWVQKADICGQRGLPIFGVLPAATGNSWFHDFIVRRSSAFCLLRERVRWLVPSYDGLVELKNPHREHMVVLWDHENKEAVERFVERLDGRGCVVQPG